MPTFESNNPASCVISIAGISKQATSFDDYSAELGFNGGNTEVIPTDISAKGKYSFYIQFSIDGIADKIYSSEMILYVGCDSSSIVDNQDAADEE